MDGKNKYGEIKKMSQNATNSDISSGQITEYTWDERGNLTKVVYPDGQQVTSGYDEKNNLIWQLAETGIFTRYCYDEKMVYLLETAVYLGKLDEEAEKPEYTNASRGQFAVNSYTYGDKGVLLSETNDHGFTKIYTYDTVFHNLQTVTLPESTTENPMVRSLEYLSLIHILHSRLYGYLL